MGLDSSLIAKKDNEIKEIISWRKYYKLHQLVVGLLNIDEVALEYEYEIKVSRAILQDILILVNNDKDNVDFIREQFAAEIRLALNLENNGFEIFYSASS